MNTYRKPQSVKISPIDKKITTHEVMWLSVNYINITIDCRRLTSSCLKNKEKSVETGEFK
ncbi:hypothetical protein DS964_21960 [Escherichia coli]|nr:hypothetical protein DS964_21960 [Escherichia coli]